MEQGFCHPYSVVPLVQSKGNKCNVKIRIDNCTTIKAKLEYELDCATLAWQTAILKFEV